MISISAQPFSAPRSTCSCVVTWFMTNRAFYTPFWQNLGTRWSFENGCFLKGRRNAPGRLIEGSNAVGVAGTSIGNRNLVDPAGRPRDLVIGGAARVG